LYEELVSVLWFIYFCADVDLGQIWKQYMYVIHWCYCWNYQIKMIKPTAVLFMNHAFIYYSAMFDLYIFSLLTEGQQIMQPW
jgi:hypothetical protein